MSTTWNPELYQDSHAFVWKLSRGLVGMLAPKPGERILDIGCGTGQLTAEIAAAGAEVTGIDASPKMIEQAQRNFPSIKFLVADAVALGFDREFDAVFSNAALHWVKDAEGPVRSIERALKPGGRLVAEFGGHGNVARLIETAAGALRRLGFADPRDLNPWYFPTVGEYASLLERNGFLVGYAALIDRPTPLENGRDGLKNWFEMFWRGLLDPLTPEQKEAFLSDVETRAAPALFHDGVWTADYRRLRIAATRL